MAAHSRARDRRAAEGCRARRRSAAKGWPIAIARRARPRECYPSHRRESLSAAASAACRTECEVKHRLLTENVGEREMLLDRRRRLRRLHQGRRLRHRHWLANAAIKFGVDTPLARGDARLATKSPDHRVVTWFGVPLRCGPAAIRERPHPGTEDGVEIAHAFDLRRGMPLALADSPLVPFICPLRGEGHGTRLNPRRLRGHATWLLIGDGLRSGGHCVAIGCDHSRPASTDSALMRS